MITKCLRTPQILSRCCVPNFFLLLFIGLSISFMSCNESSVVGLDVQPEKDLLHIDFIDTTSLITKTIREDSLRTDESLLISGNVLMGKYLDPVFGEATASIYTQALLSTGILATSFGSNPVCDSLVLSLAYNTTYYGKTERKQQTVNVRQVVDDIIIGTKYSNKTLNTSSLDLASGHTFTPRPLDSVSIVAGIKLKPQLRIPLDVNFGQVLLNNQTTGNLANNTVFPTFMKGLYITTENTTSLSSGEGNILSFNMPGSAMTIYYHYTGKTLITNTQPTPVDSIIKTKYDFSLGSGAARFTHFTHNYASVDPNLMAQLGSVPPAQNDVLFVQSISGLKTKIEMPTLMHWIDSGPIAINKAELVIKADMTPLYQLDTFAAPATLIVFGLNDDGTNFILPDAFEGSTYFGGVYNATTIGEYHFNITRYIQQILDKTIHNNGMYLLASGGGVGANRVAVGGGGTGSAYRMKLNITSTKLH